MWYNRDSIMSILGFIFGWGLVFYAWWLFGKTMMRRENEAQHPYGDFVQKIIFSSLGRMLALLSKADGRISKGEVETASRCLRSLGLREDEYRECVAAFNSIHYPSRDMFRKCAQDYAAVVKSEARVLLYEMLWKVASADGVLDPGEDELLRAAIGYFGIDPAYYQYFKRMYFCAGRADNRGDGRFDSKLRDAYAKLGCSPDDSDETVKTAYRKLAMRYHPDRLKAEGVPDSMIQIATRSMAEINAAWDLIRKERKYS